MEIKQYILKRSFLPRNYYRQKSILWSGQTYGSCCLTTVPYCIRKQGLCMKRWLAYFCCFVSTYSQGLVSGKVLSCFPMKFTMLR